MSSSGRKRGSETVASGLNIPGLFIKGEGDMGVQSANENYYADLFDCL